MSIATESKFLLQKFIQKQFIQTYLTHSVPFRLFKSNAIHRELTNPKICLPLNRFTDSIALINSLSHISIWSESHLEFVKSLNRKNPINLNKIVLKNPYKTQQLIRKSFDLGIKNMLVDNFEQLRKIHECRCLSKTQNLQFTPLNFIWSVSDLEKDFKQIETLKTYNIKIGGLIFSEALTKRQQKVKKFIENINNGLPQKKKIKLVYLESRSQDFESNYQHYQNEDFFIKNKIETVMDKIDFKMTDKYWIAARVIGQNRKKELVLNQEAYHYVLPEQIKHGQVVQQNGKKWIFSPVNFLPGLKTLEDHEKKGLIASVI